MDGDTAIAGAAYHNSSGGYGTGSGAAYIYVYSDATWSQQAKLLPNNIKESARFGRSITIDGNTAIVGAPYSGGAPSTGSVYIFTRTNSTWSQQTQLGELLPPSPKKVSSFGYSVDVDGDIAVVAATRTAYVFTRNSATGSWSYQAELKATDGNDLPNATNPPHIEKIIAISGNTIIYGSYVFISDPKTGDWSQQAQLFPRGLTERAKYEYGTTVAIDGNTAVIGAMADNRYDGSAYVFVRHPTTGVWSQQAKLVRRDAPKWFELPKLFPPLFGSFRFGASVAIKDDTIVVGSFSPGTFGNPDSAAYVFKYNSQTGRWLQQAKLLPKDYKQNQEFARSVDITGNQVIVGVPGQNIGKLSTGAAYVFNRVDASEPKQ